MRFPWLAILNAVRIGIFWCLVPPKLALTALVIILGMVWSVLDWLMERVEP